MIITKLTAILLVVFSWLMSIILPFASGSPIAHGMLIMVIVLSMSLWVCLMLKLLGDETPRVRVDTSYDETADWYQRYYDHCRNNNFAPYNEINYAIDQEAFRQAALDQQVNSCLRVL